MRIADFREGASWSSSPCACHPGGRCLCMRGCPQCNRDPGGKGRASAFPGFVSVGGLLDRQRDHCFIRHRSGSHRRRVVWRRPERGSSHCRCDARCMPCADLRVRGSGSDLRVWCRSALRVADTSHERGRLKGIEA